MLILKNEAGTVSSIDVFLKINGKEKINCQLKRHLSPMTVGLITRTLPIEGNAHKINHSIIYFETKIDSGIERKRTDFKIGDIAFLPNEGSLCFYVDNVFDGKPMTIIGKMINNIDKLKAVKAGDVLSLSSD